MKKALSLVLTLAMALSLLAGCSSSTTSSESSDTSSTSSTTSSTTTTTTTGDEEAATTTVDPSQEPDGVVPGTSINFYSSIDCVTLQMPGQVGKADWMYPLIYDTLFHSPSGNYDDMTGLLAKEWDISDDNLTWTITLHDNVYYANGNHMTADLAVRCLQYLEDIGASAFSSVTSYEATDEYEITFHCSSPKPEFMYQFSSAHCALFDPTLVDELGVTVDAFYMAASGPYYISDYGVGDYITFTANPYYWNEERMPHIETLNCKVILDTNTQVTTLLSGEMDYGQLSDYNGYETVLTNDSLNTIQFYGDTKTLYINVEGECPELANARVREALTLMLDMDQLAIAATGGYGYASTSPLGDGVPYDDQRAYDPEAGLAILAEEGIDPTDIVITPVVDTTLAPLFTNMQAQYSAYGITIDFAVQDNPAMMSAIWAGEWDVSAPGGGVNRYTFASPVDTCIGETGKHQLCRDPEITPVLWDILERAFSSPTREEEMELLVEACEVLDEGYAYLGAVQVPRWVISSEKIENIVIDQYTGIWNAWESWVV